MDCLVTVLISWVGCRKKEKGAERRNELSPDSFPRRSTIHQQTEQVSYLAHCSLSFYGLPPLRLLGLSTCGWTDLPGSYRHGAWNGEGGHQQLRSVSGLRAHRGGRKHTLLDETWLRGEGYGMGRAMGGFTAVLDMVLAALAARYARGHWSCCCLFPACASMFPWPHKTSTQLSRHSSRGRGRARARIGSALIFAW